MLDELIKQYPTEVATIALVITPILTIIALIVGVGKWLFDYRQKERKDKETALLNYKMNGLTELRKVLAKLIAVNRNKIYNKKMLDSNVSVPDKNRVALTDSIVLNSLDFQGKWLKTFDDGKALRAEALIIYNQQDYINAEGVDIDSCITKLLDAVSDESATEAENKLIGCIREINKSIIAKIENK